MSTDGKEMVARVALYLLMFWCFKRIFRCDNVIISESGESDREPENKMNQTAISRENRNELALR